MPPRVTLLTDFGAADGYVAAMKGVIAARLPDAILDDAGHDVPQGDVIRGAWALGRYWRRYPAGTVHLVVVDPGVGTDRRPLALTADGRHVVAPDNGVVSPVLEGADAWSAVEIDPARLPDVGTSATFHGRDVFAPATALLAGGTPLSDLGAPLSDPVRRVEPVPRRSEDRIEGEVVVEDRFGNLITNVPGSWVEPGWRVRIGGRSIAVVETYGTVEPGDLVALVNSSDRLEVAVRNGSGARRLGAGPGVELEVAPPDA